MKLTIDTGKMRDFPEEDILIYCPINPNGLIPCGAQKFCLLKSQGYCRDAVIKGKLASASPIKRWLSIIKE